MHQPLRYAHPLINEIRRFIAEKHPEYDIYINAAVKSVDRRSGDVDTVMIYVEPSLTPMPVIDQGF